MIDVNTSAAALQNSAAIQGLMNPPAMQDFNRAALQNIFQRGNILLQGQLEEKRQQNEIAARAALEGVQQSGENQRQAAALQSTSDISAAQRSSELQREREAESSATTRATTIQGLEEKSRIEMQNRVEAEQIIRNPDAARLGIDFSKYDLNNPGDAGKLVNDFNQAASKPGAMEKIYTDQAERLTNTASDLKTKIMGTLNTPDGQNAYVQRMLADPGVQSVLVNSHNFPTGQAYDAAKFDALRSMAGNPATASQAVKILNSDYDTASHGAILGLRDPAAIASIQSAKQNVIGSLLSPQTGTPQVQQLYSTMQDVMGMRNQALNSGYIRSPDAISRALGTGAAPVGGPLTNALKSAGAGTSAPAAPSTPPAASAGLSSPDISKLPPSPGELSVTGLDPQSAAIVQAKNLQIRQQNYDSHVVQPLQQISQQRQQLQAQIAKVRADPNYGAMSNTIAGLPTMMPGQGSQQAQTLSQLGQRDAALAQQQAQFQNIKDQFDAHAAGGLTQPQQPMLAADSTVGAGVTAPAVGATPYQLAGSNQLMSAAYAPAN